MIIDDVGASGIGKSTISDWWFQPLWKILVNWDDYSQHMETYKMFQTTNQMISGHPISERNSIWGLQAYSVSYDSTRDTIQ